MLDPRFVYLASALISVGTALYAIQMLRGQVRPNRVSWLMWSALPIITFFAAVSEGAGLSAVLALVIGLGDLVIVALSFFVKQAYWKTTRLDLVCGACSILAIALWAVTSDGNIAIAIVIVADVLASMPTMIKSYNDPGSEHALTYLLSAVAAFVTLLTISTWTFADAAFSIYIFIACSVIVLLIKVIHRRTAIEPAVALAEAETDDGPAPFV